MNMRRYSMKARRVTALKRLLRNDRVSVKRIDVAAHENREDSVYVFFDQKEVILERETIRMQTVRDVAAIMRKDKVYEKLTNAKQRILYLCGACTLTKSDAEDVVEMAKIIEVEAEVVADKRKEEEMHEVEAMTKEMEKEEVRSEIELQQSKKKEIKKDE